MSKTLKTIVSKVLAVGLLPVIVYGFFIIIKPDIFLALDMPVQLFNQCLSTTVLAWGMSFGMLMGNMDMSACAEQVLGTVVAIVVANMVGGPIGLVLGVLAVAIVIGAAKAILMATINIKSMVLSIAYTLVLGGLGYAIVGGESNRITFSSGIFGNRWVTIPVFVAAGIIMYCLHKYSVFGAQCSALSGNEALALSSGIKKEKVESIAIVVCSLYIAISAFIAVVRTGTGSPAQGLSSLSNVFGAMSGVFVAMALTRYVPMVVGILVGCYSMNIIIFGMMASNFNAQIRSTVNGSLLLLLLAFTTIKGKMDAEKMRRAAAASLAAGDSAAISDATAPASFNIPYQ